MRRARGPRSPSRIGFESSWRARVDEILSPSCAPDALRFFARRVRTKDYTIDRRSVGYGCGNARRLSLDRDRGCVSFRALYVEQCRKRDCETDLRRIDGRWWYRECLVLN